MNKKIYISEQEVLSLLEPTRNKDINKIKLNPANTKEHEMWKCDACYNLLKQKKRFVTEAIFKNNKGRCDILNITDKVAIEIVCTEREESIIRKKAKYPVPIIFIKTRSE